MVDDTEKTSDNSDKTLNYVILGSISAAIIAILGVLIYGIAAGKFKSGFEFFLFDDENGKWIVFGLMLLGGIVFFSLSLIFYFMHKKHYHDRWKNMGGKDQYPKMHEYIRRQLVNKRIYIMLLLMLFSYFFFFSAISLVLSLENTDSIFKASGRICPAGTIPDREPGKSTDLID